MIVSVPTMSLPAFPNNVSSIPAITGSANFDLNAAGASVAYVGQMPSTQTISRVFFRVNSATTGCTVLVRLEEVRTGDGLPNGTPIHANASASITIANGAGNYEVSYTPFQVTRGTLFALVIQHDLSLPNPIAIRFAFFADDNHGSGLPYCLDSGTHVATLAPCFGIGTSGSAVPVRHMWPIIDAGLETYNSGSTPDTRGNKITINAKVRVCGLRVWTDLDATAKAILYGADGSTILASANLFTNLPPDTLAFPNDALFTSAVELNPGTYYIAVEATSGTNIGLGVITLYDSTWRAGSPFGGADVVYSTCTQTPSSTGSWTDSTNKQAMISLLIDGIDNGSSETSYTFAS
jgi:hypothetical protein